jgi:hypothetical protein
MALPQPDFELIGSVEEYPASAAPYDLRASAGYYLVNTGSEILALNLQAPRKAGCRIYWDTERGRFQDPCFGTIFDLTGRTSMDRRQRPSDATGYKWTIRCSGSALSKRKRRLKYPHPTGLRAVGRAGDLMAGNPGCAGIPDIRSRIAKLQTARKAIQEAADLRTGLDHPDLFLSAGSALLITIHSDGDDRAELADGNKHSTHDRNHRPEPGDLFRYASLSWPPESKDHRSFFA